MRDLSELIELLGDQAADDIAWSESVQEPTTAEEFAGQAVWVICCSGMKYTVARLIEGRVMKALEAGIPVRDVFGHNGKAAAMETIWRDRGALFTALRQANDKVAFCETLPWIGSITKWHLAKNFGVDCAKPDVHLQRLADREGVSVHDLCARIAKQTGYRIATVDLILWRACATGVLNSRTGEITRPAATLRALAASGETQ